MISIEQSSPSPRRKKSVKPTRVAVLTDLISGILQSKTGREVYEHAQNWAAFLDERLIPHNVGHMLVDIAGTVNASKKGQTIDQIAVSKLGTKPRMMHNYLKKWVEGENAIDVTLARYISSDGHSLQWHVFRMLPREDEISEEEIATKLCAERIVERRSLKEALADLVARQCVTVTVKHGFRSYRRLAESFDYSPPVTSDDRRARHLRALQIIVSVEKPVAEDTFNLTVEGHEYVRRVVENIEEARKRGVLVPILERYEKSQPGKIKYGGLVAMWPRPVAGSEWRNDALSACTQWDSDQVVFLRSIGRFSEDGVEAFKTCDATIAKGVWKIFREAEAIGSGEKTPYVVSYCRGYDPVSDPASSDGPNGPQADTTKGKSKELKTRLKRAVIIALGGFMSLSPGEQGSRTRSEASPISQLLALADNGFMPNRDTLLIHPVSIPKPSELADNG